MPEGHKKADRVVFIVRCHGTPDEYLENEIIHKLGEATEYPDRAWGILTIGRQYYHDLGYCKGHADPDEWCV